MHRVAIFGAAALVAITSTVVAPSPVESATAAGYQPLPAPQRLVDTRPGESTVDGRFEGIKARRADSTLAVDVAGRAGLPATVGSVVLNLTVDQPTAPGFLTVWPCDQKRPTASNLNYAAGQVVAVAALSKVDPDGRICIYTLAATHLIVDVAGQFPAGTFAPLPAPERLADTRAGERTIDGRFAGAGRRPADSAYEIRIAGRGSVPAGASAVAMTVTATTVSDLGFLTVYPCGAKRPNASNVNYQPGSTTPNLVFARLDKNGSVCVYTLRPVDLVVDVTGVLPTTVFDPLPSPRRLLDTRVGEATYDGEFRGGGVQQDGATLQLPVAGRAGVPADATAVVLNVTSTGSSTPGFVTAHPQGSALPSASNVNFTNGGTVANLVVAGLGPSGDVCLFTKGVTHLVVDVAGWLTGPPPSTVTPSCPGRRAPAGAEAYRNQLVRRPGLQRVIGTDKIAVYICKIPADSVYFDGSRQHNATAADFAAFANAQVTPYFDEVSGGFYATEFYPGGTIQAGRDDSPNDCIDAAESRTKAPFTNVLVADSTLAGGGFASPGTIFASDSGPDFGVFDRAPADPRRGGWVGGATISERPNVGTIVHEIGHTLHWPHSFIGPSEYDNPVDVMSGGIGFCPLGSGQFYTCDPGNTLAFNRFAASWLRNGQVIAHPTGTANYLLDRPERLGSATHRRPRPCATVHRADDRGATRRRQRRLHRVRRRRTPHRRPAQPIRRPERAQHGPDHPSGTRRERFVRPRDRSREVGEGAGRHHLRAATSG